MYVGRAGTYFAGIVSDKKSLRQVDQHETGSRLRMQVEPLLLRNARRVPAGELVSAVRRGGAFDDRRRTSVFPASG